MNKSMRSLFGKVVRHKDREDWIGTIYIYGSEKDPYGHERAMAIRLVKEKNPDQYGLPMIHQAKDFNIVKPTEKQCRQFIRNAFNAFR